MPSLARALIAWTSGRWLDAIRECREAIALDSFAVFNLSGILANAILRVDDRVGAGEAWTLARDHPETSAWSVGALRQLAAIAASFDGRRAEATELLIEAGERYARIGAGLDWGVAALNALLVAPDEPRVRRWADEARASFVALEARPLVEMLDAATPSATGDGDRSDATQPDEAPAVSGSA